LALLIDKFLQFRCAERDKNLLDSPAAAGAVEREFAPPERIIGNTREDLG
jgi:hypothetical protein